MSVSNAPPKKKTVAHPHKYTPKRPGLCHGQVDLTILLPRDLVFVGDYPIALLSSACPLAEIWHKPGKATIRRIPQAYATATSTPVRFKTMEMGWNVKQNAGQSSLAFEIGVPKLWAENPDYA